MSVLRSRHIDGAKSPANGCILMKFNRSEAFEFRVKGMAKVLVPKLEPRNADLSCPMPLPHCSVSMSRTLSVQTTAPRGELRTRCSPVTEGLK